MFFTIGNGIQLSWPSPSVPKLQSNDLGFFMSEEEISRVVMLAPLGFIIGSPLSAFFLDKIGRKYTLLIFAPIQVTTWLTIATSKSSISLYCARIMMGISEGGMYTALPAYIGEISEPKVRGVTGSCISLGILFGTLAINVYGSYVSIRTAAYISLVFPIMFIITFVWMPETPYYYIANGADYKARASLKALRRIKNVETELAEIKEAVERQMSEPGRYRDIFMVKGNLKSFVILAVLRILQQLSGMFAISLYLQVIFKNAQSTLSPEASAITCVAVRAVLASAGSILVDRYGRRIMIATSCIGSAIMLVCLSVYFQLQSTGYNLDNLRWFPLTFILLYYISCSMGLLLVPTLMMGELLPSNIKAKALMLLNINFGLGMSTCAQVFQYTKTFGAHVPFYIFATACFLCAVFTYTFVPETKGKTLEEIQRILRKSKTEKEATILMQPHTQKIVPDGS